MEAATAVGSSRRRKLVVQCAQLMNEPTTGDIRATTKGDKGKTSARRQERKPVMRATNRERNQSKYYNLTLDVNALKQHVCDLALRRSLLQTRALYLPHDLDGSILKRAAHYFVVFNRGYRSSEYKQPQYVGSMMDENLSLGITGLGTDMLMEQWRRYTDYFAIRYFSAPTLSLISDEVERTCTVRATLQFRGAFTMRTLQMVFPAALRDPDLTQRLLGKEMVVPVLFHLHFNQAGRVTRHDFEADFFTALATALQDASRAAAIMQEAKVAEEGMVDAVEDADRSLLPVDQLARTKRVRSKEMSIRSTRGDHADTSSTQPQCANSGASFCASDRRDGDHTDLDIPACASPTSPSMGWIEPDDEGANVCADKAAATATINNVSRLSVSFLLS